MSSSASAAKSGMCGMCDAAPRRYKCPACSLPYCSAECFKAHKPACVKPAPPPPAPPTREQQMDTLLADADDIGAHVPIERLERLRADEGIRAAARDPRLQRILRTIDSSPDPAKALEEARKAEGAPFRAFLDSLLLAIGAGEAQPGPLPGMRGPVLFTGLPGHASRRGVMAMGMGSALSSSVAAGAGAGAAGGLAGPLAGLDVPAAAVAATNPALADVVRLVQEVGSTDE